MKAIVLDGSAAHDGMGERVRAALALRLHALGWEVEHVALRDQSIGCCAGDFNCWVRTPGVCGADDDNRRVAAAIMGADLAVYLSPVTFGGYASTLQRMVEHQIQNISPFFAGVAGETHHHKRYSRYPDHLALGWQESPDPHAAAIFRHLAHRNAINVFARRSASDVLHADLTQDELNSRVADSIDDLLSGRPSSAPSLPAPVAPADGRAEVRRALLLVGSPRTRRSTSNSLGAYLFEQLAARSIETRTVYLHTMVRSAGRMQELLDAVDEADLVALAVPLYVDSMPAPAIETLERIAGSRRPHATRVQLFAAIVNCGFPEARQCATAVAICGSFARQAHFEWAGSLSLGGGGMVDGAPLVAMGAPTVGMRKALDLAARALALGAPIPPDAQDLMGRLPIPHWLYRLAGSLNWIRRARRNGAQKSLKRRPYAETPE